MRRLSLAPFLGASLALHAVFAVGLVQALPNPGAVNKWPGSPISIDLATARFSSQTVDSSVAAPNTTRASPLNMARDSSDAQPSSAPSESAAGQNVNSNHLIGEVNSLLAQHLIYPEVARQHGWEGTVIVKLVLGPNGVMREIRLQHGSGYDVLDRAAIDSLHRIGRIAGMDALASNTAQQINLPIQFRLLDH